MLALDLFNTKYERELQEGAVDDLEARRIDTLNDRMQDLLARAKEPAYKKNPAALSALKKQFQQVKDERDSYYKVNTNEGAMKRRLESLALRMSKERFVSNAGEYGMSDKEAAEFWHNINGVEEAGIPGNVPVEKIPGKEDLLKGRGRTYYEDEVDEDDVEDFIKAGGKITYGKPQKGPRRPGMSLASRHIGGGNDRMKPSRSGRAANTQGKPVVSVEDAEKKNSETAPLDQKLQRLKVQARRQFPRAHTDDEALILKLLDKETQDDRLNRQTDARQDAELRKNFALDREQEDEIEDLQTQVGVKEHGGGIGPKQRWQDLMPEQTNPKDDDWYDKEDQDTELRSGDYVRDTMDGESGEVFRMQGDPYERRVRILDRDGKGWYIEPSRLTRVDSQDPDVQRYFGKQRQRDMDEATGDSKFDAVMSKISKDPWTQLNSDPNWESEIEDLVDQHIEPWLLAMERSGMPITRDGKTLNPGWRKRYEQISTQLAQKYLSSKKFNPRDPDMVGKIRAAIDNHTDQSRNVAGQLSAYADDLPLHRYADAFDADGMTANIRDAMAGLAPRDDDDDDDGYAPRPEANPRRLDPGNMEEAVDEKGALKAAQAAAKFMIRNLDDRAALKDYSMHFWSPVKFYQGATMAMRGAGHDEIVRHITQDRPAQFESGVAEGWSDAMLARRTGTPRTPYSVYIKGKKWKDFENEDHAEAVANKLRAKFKADGRDPETITIAPTDYDQPIKEDNDSEAVERAILNRIMVAHTDLLMKYGPDKVMQAAEEVSYNVGDVDEIGTSDVSAYVAQVKQILGAVSESKLDEKWTAKYKSSINCADPKGFSQKAHCAGRKK
jgi:hypothetical protein